MDRGKTVTKSGALMDLEKASSESRFPKLLKILKVELIRRRVWSRAFCV